MRDTWNLNASIASEGKETSTFEAAPAIRKVTAALKRRSRRVTIAQLITWSIDQLVSLFLGIVIFSTILMACFIWSDSVMSTGILSLITGSAIALANPFLLEYAYPGAVGNSKRFRQIWGLWVRRSFYTHTYILTLYSSNSNNSVSGLYLLGSFT